MTQTMKVLSIVFLAIVIIIGLLIFLYYYFFVGITKKAKYEKCAKTCEDAMLLESNIPVCKQKCEEIAEYDPATNSSTTPTGSQSKTEESESGDKLYDCQYVWPQQIVEKGTAKLVLSCPSIRPWCRPGDGTREDISCCADYSEITKEKTDCKKLSELQK
jgi:hypothetical protein